MKSVVFAILESIFQAEDQEQKIQKFEKWLPEVSAVGFYNPDCILVNFK